MIDILLIYLILFGIKLIAYHFSGFTAILADAMHSIMDIAMILILLVSERFARRSPDLSHPLGHEMAKNIASLIVGVVFATVLSFELAKEGLGKILNPQSFYQNIDIALGIEIIVLIMLFIAVLLSAKREGVLNRTLFVESVNDSLSTFAAIFGVILVWSGYPFFDGVATLLIAVLIFYNSLRLIVNNARILLGLSPSDEFYESVERVCADIDEVKGVHDMVGVYTGENSIHLDIHVTVDGKMSVEDADKLSVKIADDIMAKHPEVRHISVHFCPHEGERRRVFK